MKTVFPADLQPGDRPVWIDLLNGDAAEIAEVQRISGLRVPDRDALSEIENSSRIFAENDSIYLSMPLITAVDELETVLIPVGFVISDHTLLTVRFGQSSAFDAVIKAVGEQPHPKAEDVFAQILEAMVDRAADRLEHAGAGLDTVSRSAFRVDRSAKRDLAGASDTLRGVLRKIGQTGDNLSKVRDTLLGLDRITAFMIDSPHCRFSPPVIQRLKAVHGDIVSLSSYEEHLANKVQFLLDATLGFINIEQNDIVKVLTVVSVVGVPPVLIAGVYGMNFKNMPELSWAYGYPFSLVAMVVSALLPIAWFKWRKWM